MVAIYEPVIGVKYLFFKWLGIEGDVGFRFMAINNPAIKQNFNSPTYSFGGVVYVGEFYRSVIKPRLKTKSANNSG